MDVLKTNAEKDSHSSASELAKFGFVNPYSAPGSSIAETVPSSSPIRYYYNSIIFGSFSDPVIVDPNASFTPNFTGANFLREFSSKLKREQLELIQDLRFAGYSEKEIRISLNLLILPPNEIIFEFLGRC